MIQTERLQRLLEILKEQRFAEVEQLALQLDVSSMTIRRDLDKLSEQGVVQRCHGGATLMSDVKMESSFSDKQNIAVESKIRIAKKAAQYISENDSILLDAGTTNYELAKQLVHHRNITVITSDLAIANLLAETENVVIMIGGIIQSSTHSVIGSLAYNMLDDFRVDKAFLGTSSIDANFNMLTPTIEKMEIKRRMMDIAQCSYLLADKSKFYSQSLYKICSIDKLNGIITDKKFSSKELTIFKEKGIHIICCDEEEQL